MGAYTSSKFSNFSASCYVLLLDRLRQQRQRLDALVAVRGSVLRLAVAGAAQTKELGRLCLCQRAAMAPFAQGEGDGGGFHPAVSRCLSIQTFASKLDSKSPRREPSPVEYV